MTTLTCTGLNLPASTNRAFTLEVRIASLLRAPSEEGPATTSSFVTPRTLGTPRTSFSTSAFAAASGTSPDSSTARLYEVTLTCTLSP